MPHTALYARVSTADQTCDAQLVALRDYDPVHMFENEQGEFWVLSRFKDVFAAAVDAKTFSSSRGAAISSDFVRRDLPEMK